MWGHQCDCVFRPAVRGFGERQGSLGSRGEPWMKENED